MSGRSSRRQQDAGEVVWRRPRSWQVLGLALVSVVLLAWLHWVELPVLQEMARGKLLDLRPTGYSLEDARGILYHLGEEGRARYLFPYLALDMLLAPCLSLAIALGSLRLVHGGVPVKGRIAVLLPALGVVMPILAGLFDLWENIQLYQIIPRGIDISVADIDDLMRATSFKFGFYLFGMIGFVVIYIVSFFYRKKHGLL